MLFRCLSKLHPFFDTYFTTSSHLHIITCSFQTFAWNPGVLACLKAHLQPVNLPSTQSSIQVSPGSSPCPLTHCHDQRNYCSLIGRRVSMDVVFFFFSLIGSSNNNSGNSTEEVSRGVAVEKLDSVKKWGINTYKVLCNMSITLFSQAELDVMRFSSCWVKCMSTMQCTKQMFSERFGRGSRTVDLELEAQIDVLRETKNKYEIILRLATALTSHFLSMVQTQQALGDTFTELSQKSPELQVP